jgi:hypothetical protein
MREKDTITVYWAPISFDQGEESWSMLYPEPYALRKDLNDRAEINASIRICPAIKDGTSNVFVLSSSLDEDFDIPLETVEAMVDAGLVGQSIPIDGASVDFRLTRAPEYKDYYNYTYNLAWQIFADEPLEMRATSPWFPPSSPLEKASLLPGQFDIGRWYRPIYLEYITPKDSTHFSLKAGDPLAYLEFMTDKKIIFKRYIPNDRLIQLSQEFTFSPKRFGFFKKLSEHYAMAKKAKMPEIVLAEIKKNLVE